MHSHTHLRATQQDPAQTKSAADAGPASLLMSGASARGLVALGLVALLWALVAWALGGAA